MTSDRLIDMMIARLVIAHGKSKHHWRKAIGPVRIYSRATHPHCNWAFTPSGTADEISVIETLLDDLHLRHPLIDR